MSTISSSAVQRVGDELATTMRHLDRGATDLVSALEAHSDVLGLSDVSPRLGTGRRARDLIVALRDAADHVDRIRVLADFDLPNELQPLARSLATAADVAAALQGANWQLLNQLPTLGERAANALTALRSAAEADQMHVDLAPALIAAAQEVTRILVERRGKEDGFGGDSVAQQERVRREQEDRRRREQEEELKRREQEAADRERRLREQEEEFRRRQEEAQRDAETRASQEHTVEVEVCRSSRPCSRI